MKKLTIICLLGLLIMGINVASASEVDFSQNLWLQEIGSIYDDVWIEKEEINLRTRAYIVIRENLSEYNTYNIAFRYSPGGTISHQIESKISYDVGLNKLASNPFEIDEQVDYTVTRNANQDLIFNLTNLKNIEAFTKIVLLANSTLPIVGPLGRERYSFVYSGPRNGKNNNAVLYLPKGYEIIDKPSNVDLDDEGTRYKNYDVDIGENPIFSFQFSDPNQIARVDFSNQLKLAFLTLLAALVVGVASNYLWWLIERYCKENCIHFHGGLAILLTIFILLLLLDMARRVLF